MSSHLKAVLKCYLGSFDKLTQKSLYIDKKTFSTFFQHNSLALNGYINYVLTYVKVFLERYRESSFQGLLSRILLY